VAKSLVFQAAILLLPPGVVAIVGRVSGRGTIAVVSGGTVYGAGLVGAYTFLVLSGVQAALAGSGPIDAALVSAADSMADSAAALPMFALALLLFHLIGLPWLAFGSASATAFLVARRRRHRRNGILRAVCRPTTSWRSCRWVTS
jgi:hypothetical protein